MKKLTEINIMMDNNILPDCFNYSLQENFDWNKVTYNDHNSFERFANKFTTGWQNIPGFDLVIQDMANFSLSPIDEMNFRKNI